MRRIQISKCKCTLWKNKVIEWIWILDQEQDSMCFNHLVSLLTVHRNTIMQKEKEQDREQHEQSVQRLLAKHETDLSHLHQEHALSAAKVYFDTVLCSKTGELHRILDSFLHLFRSSSILGLRGDGGL